MLVREAVEHLDGHTIVTTERAKAICEALEIPVFSRNLIMSWANRQEAFDTYGFVAVREGAGEGVDGLDLSYHVAKELGLERPGACFTGVGSQARANQQAIRRKLSELGKL